MFKKIAAVAASVALVGTLGACGGFEPTQQEKQLEEVEKKSSAREVYLPKNDVEFNNYNRAQELYDDPNAILWCTTTWGNPSSPLLTVPITGKLTTSATSYFAPTEVKKNPSGSMVNVPNRSVDGMFHGGGNYRYGFTPGGQYAEFSLMGTFCSTALTQFQRQNTFVEGVDTDANVDALQEKAEQALKDGKPQKAQDILEGK